MFDYKGVFAMCLSGIALLGWPLAYWTLVTGHRNVSLCCLAVTLLCTVMFLYVVMKGE